MRLERCRARQSIFAIYFGKGLSAEGGELCWLDTRRAQALEWSPRGRERLASAFPGVLTSTPCSPCGQHAQATPGRSLGFLLEFDTRSRKAPISRILLAVLGRGERQKERPAHLVRIGYAGPRFCSFWITEFMSAELFWQIQEARAEAIRKTLVGKN